MTLPAVRTRVATPSGRPAGGVLGRRPDVVASLLLCCAATFALSACAPRSCANPYVLDFLDKADARANLSHVALLHDPVLTMPGATPDTLSCSVWERVRVPGSSRTTLQPQNFQLRQVGDGWELDTPPAPGGGP